CFFSQAEDGIRDFHVTGVQTCALPISSFWAAGEREDSSLPSPSRMWAMTGARAIISQKEYVGPSGSSSAARVSGSTTARLMLGKIGRASCREGGKSSGYEIEERRCECK